MGTRSACRRNASRARSSPGYGILNGFQLGPDDDFISRGRAAGRVTDDVEQAVLLGETLVEGRGRVGPGRVAQARLAWGLTRDRAEAHALDLIYRLVGTGVVTNEAVPATIAQGQDPVAAMRRANAAAISVTRAGSATAPHCAELDQFLAGSKAA